MKLIDQFQKVYQSLGDHKIEDIGLLEVKNDKIITPFSDDTLSLFSYRSSRPDEFRSSTIIEGLINRLKTDDNFKRLNHIGFCYKVGSKDVEAARLTNLVRSGGSSIYREPSSDDGDWLFVGDFSGDITNPVLELIPHEGKTADKWVDYWLPHIQFDIDTNLSPDEVKAVIRDFINEPFVPYSIQIDGITYIQRVRLGCVEGVNIYLDIATNNRDMNYRKSWEKLT